MVTTLLLILFAMICFYLGIILGIYIAYKQLQDGFSDTMNKASSMFLNSVDKIKESYETLFADFKNSSELPSSTNKGGQVNEVYN